MFTKGEWTSFIWDTKRGFNIFCEKDFIASVPLGIYPRTMIEAEANANLISAAPNLYEALRQLVSVTSNYTKEYQNALQALSKAEGVK